MTAPGTSTLLAAAVALVAVLAGCGGPDFTRQDSAGVAPPPGSLPGVRLELQAFGSMCAQLPDGAKVGSFGSLGKLPVASAVATSTFTQRFSDALRDSGLADSLDRLPEATVFAPYDSGFADLRDGSGAQRSNAAPETDRESLSRNLRYHVVAGERYDRAGLLAAGTVRTMGGVDLRIVDTGNGIDLIDASGATAHVLCGNIQTANANLYLIDRVLDPTPRTAAHP